MEFAPKKLTLHTGRFAVCKLAAEAPLPAWVHQSSWLSITRSAEELSIICKQEYVPADVIAERDFRLLKLEGPLPFTAVGILADLARALANAEVPILAVSTYDTDYLLVRETHLKRATTALKAAGYTVDEQGP